MSIIRVVYRSDKSVAILYPSNKRKRSNETEQKCIQRRIEKMYNEFKPLPYDDIDSSELPQSREDRDAWQGEKGKGISVDETKAAKLKANKEIKTKIDKRIRKIAIEDLKNKGELPADYEE